MSAQVPNVTLLTPGGSTGSSSTKTGKEVLVVGAMKR